MKNLRTLTDYTKEKIRYVFFLLNELCFRILSMKPSRCILLIGFGSLLVYLFTLISCSFLSHKETLITLATFIIFHYNNLQIRQFLLFILSTIWYTN